MSIFAVSHCPRCRQRVWLDQNARGDEPAVEAVPCGRCKSGLADAAQPCMICLDDLDDPVRYASVNNESWSNNRCHHRFCRACLRGHIRTQLGDGAFHVRCPGEKCAYHLIDADFTKVLANIKPEEWAENKALMDRYRSLRSTSYRDHLLSVIRSQLAAVESHGLAEQIEDVSTLDDVATDSDVDASQEAACQETSSLAPMPQEFEHWAQESCQACPTCYVLVRKETGCDHIQCRCGASFCYGCGGPHGTTEGCICDLRRKQGLGNCKSTLAFWLRHKDKLSY